MDTHYLHRAHGGERAITSGDVHLRLLLKKYDKKLHRFVERWDLVASDDMWDSFKESCKQLIRKVKELEDTCVAFSEETLHEDLPTGLDEDHVALLWGILRFARKLIIDLETAGYLDRMEDREALENMEKEFYKLAPFKLDTATSVLPVGVDSHLQGADDRDFTVPIEHAMTFNLSIPEVLAVSTADQSGVEHWGQNSDDCGGSEWKHRLHRLARVLADEGDGEFFAQQMHDIARTTYSVPDPGFDDPYRKDKHDALTTLAGQVIQLSKARSSLKESEW
ncbi:hypothetical protein QFC20_004642 [Naganishia adeliensis]|uniref:Uncharacterized protein n=1 Tax=Naganishia adeliensis TaxID=92952 RepID=A0ACC2VX60_9TREE|nr:hypothetical protein QFC20_004642 [Naganishia adeliensis]